MDDVLALRQVDPLIRAHVTSLVSALGGPDHSLPNSPYVLGDDALACLKDLKKWLKAYDQKLGRLEVARTISETSLISEDLLDILADWESRASNASNGDFRIALACLELLVPLSWPLEVNGQRVSKESEVHRSYILRAQRTYKWAILNHPNHSILAAVGRILLSSLQLKKRERTARDDGIMKMSLYLFRNIALIESPSDDEFNDSRTALILEFREQRIFDILTALASGVSDALPAVDLTVLEVLYATVKGIDVESIYKFLGEKRSTKNYEVTPDHPWLRSESGATVKTGAPITRHNRFGTMTSLVLDGNSRLTVSGQYALGDVTSAIEELDKTKAPGRLQPKKTDDATEKLAIISPEAQRCLVEFVDSFIETSFNPLFVSIRKEIERESPRVQESHKEQFLYTMAWIVSARLHQPPEQHETYGFSLVSGLLDHQSLVTVTKLLRESIEHKQFKKLASAIECFKQILIVASSMSTSEESTDREVATNMLSFLFYEESTLDLLVSLPNVLKASALPVKQTCCDLICEVLKLLENFSRNTKNLYVRSKRRRSHKDSRRQNKVSKIATGRQTSDLEADDDNEDQRTDNEMDKVLNQQISEHSFEFRKFESRFFTQNCVDMFRAVLETFKDLNDQAIKRLISFFHRIFFKREEETLLYRLDFMLLLYRCLDPRNGISYIRPVREEVERFMKHYVRKLTRALQERPALYVELLFTKMPDSLFFLKFGHDNIPTQKRPKKLPVKVKAKQLKIEPKSLGLDPELSDTEVAASDTEAAISETLVRQLEIEAEPSGATEAGPWLTEGVENSI
ncbi:timeless protein-domain-containing protein [Lipomyces arxii]|uniref:timeless protein-domain-containing protein n=1 Tax=Lipomyces arxii TaxID=56418 RepID=UPI0034CE0807